MFENREERPRDRDGSGEITFWCRECVCSCSGLEEEPAEEQKSRYGEEKVRKCLQCEEDENFRPDTSGLFQGIDTESLESSEYHEDSRPAMVKRKGKMYEEFIQAICRSMEFLDDVVDVLKALSSETYACTDSLRRNPP